MVPPRTRDLVDERLGAVAVRGDQRDRQVRPGEHHQQHGESNEAQKTLNDRQRAHWPVRIQIPPDMEDAEEQSEQRKRGREPKCGEA